MTTIGKRISQMNSGQATGDDSSWPPPVYIKVPGDYVSGTIVRFEDYPIREASTGRFARDANGVQRMGTRIELDVTGGHIIGTRLGSHPRVTVYVSKMLRPIAEAVADSGRDDLRKGDILSLGGAGEGEDQKVVVKAKYKAIGRSSNWPESD